MSNTVPTKNPIIGDDLVEWLTQRYGPASITSWLQTAARPLDQLELGRRIGRLDLSQDLIAMSKRRKDPAAEA